MTLRPDSELPDLAPPESLSLADCKKTIDEQPLEKVNRTSHRASSVVLDELCKV